MRTSRQGFQAALALHVVVLLCWVAYTFYQPRIFESYGLEHLGSTFTRLQSILLVVVPPLAGLVADQYFRNRGRLLVFLMTSMSLTALIFLASAGSFLSANPSLHSGIPVLMVLWIIGMNLFYAPGLSEIARAAESGGWSRISAWTGAVTDIVFALVGPVLWFFSSLGDVVTFLAGAVLLGAAALFYKSQFSREVVIQTKERALFPFQRSWQPLAVGVGLGVMHHGILHHFSTDLPEALHGHTWVPVTLVTAAVLVFFLEHRLKIAGYFKVYLSGFLLCLLASGVLSISAGMLSVLLALILLLAGVVFVTGTAFAAGLQGAPEPWRNTFSGLVLAGFNLAALIV